MTNMYSAGRNAVEKLREKIGPEIWFTLSTGLFFVVVYFMVYHATYREPEPLVSDLVVPVGYLQHTAVTINIPDVVNPVKCTVCNNTKNPDYVILMKSRYQNETDLRAAQRNYLKIFQKSIDEYDKLYNQTSPSIKLLFLVNKNFGETDFAISKNATPDKVSLPTEEDLLEGDFLDARATLTRKVLMGLQWFVNTCDRKSMLIVADSDAKINYEDLVLTYPFSKLAEAGYRHSITCLSKNVTRIPHVLSANNTVPTSPMAYHNRTLPEFCESTGYLMNLPTASTLVKNAKTTRRFRQDDGYVTGILRFTSDDERVLRVRPPINNIKIASHEKNITKLIQELQSYTGRRHRP